VQARTWVLDYARYFMVYLKSNENAVWFQRANAPHGGLLDLDNRILCLCSGARLEPGAG
jgi:hypothetical protein